MTDDARQSLEKIISYCSGKWQEADQPPSSDWPPPDMLTAKKMAYNDVLHFARSLLDAMTPAAQDAPGTPPGTASG
jgi:hypothetical protein